MAVHERKRHGWKVPKPKGKYPWHNPVVAILAIAGDIATGALDAVEATTEFVVVAIATVTEADAVSLAGLPEDAPVPVVLSFIDLVLIAILLVCLVVLMFSYAAVLIFRIAASKVWFIGSHLQHVADPLEHFLHRVIAGTWHRTDSQAVRFLISIKTLFDMFAIAAGLATETYVTTKTKVIVEHIKILRVHMHEVRGQLKTLTLNVHDLQKDVAGVKVPSLKTLWHAVHLLQGEHGVTHARIVKLERAVEHLTKTETAVEIEIRRNGHTLTKIEHELVSIRERLHVLENEPLVHGGLSTKQLHELHTAFHFATLLAPLTALYPLTKINISNLNKLKDDPCQCPQPIKPPPIHIGGGNALIDSIVADLVIKDGI